MRDSSPERAQQEHYPQIRRVTLVGAAANIVLSTGKMLAGWLGQSQALFVDGVHSWTDLLADFLVLFAAKQAHQQADSEHPYGHGRIESIGTLLMGILLLGLALALAVDAGRHLLKPETLLIPTEWALAMALISIVVKEWLFHYTLRVAKRTHSQLLRGNAWHHRTDGLSTIIVLVGILGSFAGMPWLDAVGAIGVSMMIAYVGWDLFWQGTRDLIDTALEEGQVNSIRTLIASVDGVDHLHGLRTRRAGGQVMMDVHVQVAPRISVSEGHYIGDTVWRKLRQERHDVTDVVVHIDPEDDETQRLNMELPPRNELEARLRAAWNGIAAAQHVQRIGLHYLHGTVTVEIFLPLAAVVDTCQTRNTGVAGDWARQLRAPLQNWPQLSAVEVYFQDECPEIEQRTPDNAPK